MNPSPKILLWFRNDLRLHDQEALFRAKQKTAHIIPVYCFDIRQFAPTELGFPKTGSFRAKFLIESVANLRENLKKIGSNLIVRVGHPEEVVAELAKHFEVSAVYASQEITHEEKQVQDNLEQKLWANKIQLEFFWTATLYHLQDLPYPICNLPDVFTQFRKDVEKSVKIRSVFPTPTQLNLPFNGGFHEGNIPTLGELGLKESEMDERSVLNFKGGEDVGLERLNEYLFEKNLLKKYKETRNELLGADYSSKFSAWLANGSLSPRKIYEEVKKYESKVIANESTYWLIFELIWRDYFRFVAKKYGNKIFKLEGIRNHQEVRLNENEQLFEKWIAGETGVPFIDANMRELSQTGFMSNRGRQNVASFFVKDLKLNWLWGAMYFESKLIDYDVCSNWGNWTYVAGVGNDPRENRYFNIMSQAKRYDSKGEYVKYWLPELQDLPTSLVHHPSLISRQEQKKLGFYNGVDYPNPLVKVEKWLN